MSRIYVEKDRPARKGKKGFRIDAARSPTKGVTFLTDVMVSKSLSKTVADPYAAADLGLSQSQIDDGHAHVVDGVFICYVERMNFNSTDGEDRVYGPITLHVTCDKTLPGDFTQFGWDDLKNEFEDAGTCPTPDGKGTFWIWNIPPHNHGKIFK